MPPRHRAGGVTPSVLAATATVTARAPARFSSAAHVAAVDPVVNTSSTRITAPGAGAVDSNSPRRAARRSLAERRACAGVSRRLRRSRATGRPDARASARARTSAWSNPRRARRRRESGTHVTTSPARSDDASAIAPARCGPSARHPENFIPRIARAIGPSYRNGARTASMALGGHSAQAPIGSSVGRPHRAHSGGTMTATSRPHASHSGHPGRPHAAHLGGNTRSRSTPTPRTYDRPPTCTSSTNEARAGRPRSRSA